MFATLSSPANVGPCVRPPPPPPGSAGPVTRNEKRAIVCGAGRMSGHGVIAAADDRDHLDDPPVVPAGAPERGADPSDSGSHEPFAAFRRADRRRRSRRTACPCWRSPRPRSRWALWRSFRSRSAPGSARRARPLPADQRRHRHRTFARTEACAARPRPPRERDHKYPASCSDHVPPGVPDLCPTRPARIGRRRSYRRPRAHRARDLRRVPR